MPRTYLDWRAPYDRAAAEPYVVDGIGLLQSRLLAAEALVPHASEQVSAAPVQLRLLSAEARGPAILARYERFAK